MEQYYKNGLFYSDYDPHKSWQIIKELTATKTYSSSVKEIKT